MKKIVRELEKNQKSKIRTVKVYSSENIYKEEISYNKSINLSKPKANSSWKSSNLNLQNFTGNIYLSGISNNFLKSWTSLLGWCFNNNIEPTKYQGLTTWEPKETNYNTPEIHIISYGNHFELIIFLFK